MPDKRIDETMVDQGWAKMQLLLDEEMPVAKPKSKRPVWILWFWVFFLGFILGAGLLALFWNLQEQKKQEQFEQAIIASKDQPTTSDQTESSNGVAAQHNKANTAAENKEFNQTNASIDKKQQQDKIGNTTIKSSNSQIVANKGIREKRSFTLSPLASLLPDLKLSSLQIQPIDFPYHFHKSYTPLSGLETGTPELLEYASLDSLSEDVIQPLKIADNIRFRTGVEAYADFGATNLNRGIGVGIVFEELLSPRWTVQGGVQADYSNQDIVYQTQTTTLLETDNAGNIVGELDSEAFATNSTSNYARIDRRLEVQSAIQLFQLRAPILAQYRINKKWGALMGAGVNYVALASWQSSNSETLFDSVADPGTSFTNSTLNFYLDNAQSLDRSSSALSGEVRDLNKWGVFLQTGVRYAPISDLNLQVLYQPNFNPLFKRPEYKANSHNFRLSITYFWNK